MKKFVFLTIITILLPYVFSCGLSWKNVKQWFGNIKNKVTGGKITPGGPNGTDTNGLLNDDSNKDPNQSKGDPAPPNQNLKVGKSGNQDSNLPPDPTNPSGPAPTVLANPQGGVPQNMISNKPYTPTTENGQTSYPALPPPGAPQSSGASYPPGVQPPNQMPNNRRPNKIKPPPPPPGPKLIFPEYENIRVGPMEIAWHPFQGASLYEIIIYYPCKHPFYNNKRLRREKMQCPQPQPRCNITVELPVPGQYFVDVIASFEREGKTSGPSRMRFTMFQDNKDLKKPTITKPVKADNEEKIVINTKEEVINVTIEWEYVQGASQYTMKVAHVAPRTAGIDIMKGKIQGPPPKEEKEIVTYRPTYELQLRSSARYGDDWYEVTVIAQGISGYSCDINERSASGWSQAVEIFVKRELRFGLFDYKES